MITLSDLVLVAPAASNLIHVFFFFFAHFLVGPQTLVRLWCLYV